MMTRFALAILFLTTATGGFAAALRAPTIGLSRTSVVIDAPAGGPNPASPELVTITNTGSGKLTWTATKAAGAPWLTINPPGSSLNHNEPIDLEITVDVTGLAAGTYNSTITIAASGATNTPQTITVTLNVSATPKISVTPGTLDFTAPQGAPTIAAQNLTIQNTGGAPLDWSAAFSQIWIHTTAGTPTSGTLAPGVSTTLPIVVDNQSAAGNYSGTVTISGVGVATPKTVQVTLTVSALPLIELAPTTLTFDAPQGGANPTAKTSTLTNKGGQPMSWTASPGAAWMSVSPTSGTLAPGAPQTLTISINTAGLTEGTYIADVTITAPSATNTPKAVTVTLNVNATPKIGLNPKTFVFSVSVDSTASTGGLSVTNTGSGTLDWVTAGGASWLIVSPGGGSLTALASQPVLVTANGAGLAPGLYTTTLQIQNSATAGTPASNSPQTVAVELTVNPSTRPTHAPAGQCGFTGAEGLLPLLGLLLARRVSKRGRAA